MQAIEIIELSADDCVVNMLAGSSSVSIDGNTLLAPGSTAAAAIEINDEPVENEMLLSATSSASVESTPEVLTMENKVMIMGYDVEFPKGKTPFPAQLAVMNKVLLALKTEQHALLESPTGSGKTLALLCSSLTFQRRLIFEQAKDLEKAHQRAAQAHEEKKRQIELSNQQRDAEMYNRATRASSSAASSLANDGASTVDARDDDDQDDFYTQLKQETSPKRPLPSSLFILKKTENSVDSSASDDLESSPKLKKIKTERSFPPSPTADLPSVKHERPYSTPDDDTTTTTPTKTVPKIFFCSRTHSQLSQVVKELKSCPASYMQSPTPFAPEVKVCVLGSRAHFCVNPKATRNLEKVDEKCRGLLALGKCSFETKRRNTKELKRVAPPVWDIEDMVELGRRNKECGYYHSREAIVDANIVFCPYNYILDPPIRRAVGISLKDAIVIFDEAHNVEDTCRSSASIDLHFDVLAISIKAFEDVFTRESRPWFYHTMHRILDGLRRWMQKIDANASTILKPTALDEESNVWSGMDALTMFAKYTGMTQISIASVKEDLLFVIEHERTLAGLGYEESDEGDEELRPKMLLGALPLSTVQKVITVANYMFRDKLKYIDDFKLIFHKSRNTVGRSRRSSAADANSKGWEIKLCIWCLNAAVAFSDVIKKARSAILTSGTLSPMDSFTGELGTDFPIRLEASHVVNMRKQVFAGAIMRGPGCVDLSSTYMNQQEIGYQDSMGHLLLQFSQVIPGGILMFLPSYSLMETLETRWRKTGLWSKIDAIKTVYSEPRKAGKDFDALLDEYKSSVASARAGTMGTKSGAVFIAVYRGKVSEGIDFSNDNARAVLAVGIPFPSIKDLQVSLKRKYQDEKSSVDKKLVSGQVWYQLQAFRALNQALGRCIRHRLDYGAILLLDSRHRDRAHTTSLSKWIRPFIQEVEYSEQCLSRFINFFKRNEVELGTGAAVHQAIQLENKKPVVLKYEAPCQMERL